MMKFDTFLLTSQSELRKKWAKSAQECQSQALWQKTGLKRIINEYAKQRKFEFDVSSVIFSMVLGRLLDHTK